VSEYHDLWKSICSDICNQEYGEHSYWIAAGAKWCIAEYSAEVIRTAFASGLTVAPPVSLDQLRKIHDKSRQHLNDLEFLYNSPRAVRDSYEQFMIFNQAYRMVYANETCAYKPKPLPLYQFSWSNYAESDIVIVTLPNTGLSVGGLIALVELLNARSLLNLATILVSTVSVQKLNELNTSLMPELAYNTGLTLTSRKDRKNLGCAGVNYFLYFSIYADASERINQGKSNIQKKIEKIERRQNNRQANK
jgi:hypothetical protein